jgi:hypothetical protein
MSHPADWSLAGQEVLAVRLGPMKNLTECALQAVDQHRKSLRVDKGEISGTLEKSNGHR